MEIFTIGFTKRNAEEFFSTLERSAIKRVIDVRANNRSQLAGFTRVSNLPFLLERVSGISYRHEVRLAPDVDLLKAYRRHEIEWERYAAAYLATLEENHAAQQLSPEEFDGAVLLCSERTPEMCHRRLAAEYLRSAWGEVEIIHL